MHTISSVVQIGFEEFLYFTDESYGQVTVTIGVLSGKLSGDAMVQLTTSDRGARGMALFYEMRTHRMNRQLLLS